MSSRRTAAWPCTVLATALAAALANASLVAAQDTQTTAATALYIRNDSDGTTVITPRLSLGAPLNDTTRVDVVYTVDVWTSASVDIRTSASKRIEGGQTQPVTEQRDEIDASLSHVMGDLTLSGSYRYSVEYDYVSHGGTVGGAYNLLDNNVTLAASARAYFDTVGRAGDPTFQKEAKTLGANLSYTQVLDVNTVAQVIYEFGLNTGFLSSPYRYVRFAADGDQNITTCQSPVTMCPPEENPDSRMRHAVAIHGRRALGENLAAGGSYRLYLDDWGMLSHTVSIEGTWTPAEAWMLSAGYRFYMQNDASHYQPSYPTVNSPVYFTRDKELTSLMSHRLNVEASRSWSIDNDGGALKTILLLAPAYYSYSNFPLLDSITAIEATLAFEVRL